MRDNFKIKNTELQYLKGTKEPPLPLKKRYSVYAFTSIGLKTIPITNEEFNKDTSFCLMTLIKSLTLKKNSVPINTSN